MAHFVLRDREVRQPFLVHLFGVAEQEFEELADDETIKKWGVRRFAERVDRMQKLQLGRPVFAGC